MALTDKMSPERIIVEESNIHQVLSVTVTLDAADFSLPQTRASSWAEVRRHRIARLRALGVARGICKKMRVMNTILSQNLDGPGH